MTYLMKKNYDVELALAMISKLPKVSFLTLILIAIVVDLDDLVDLMRQ